MSGATEDDGARAVQRRNAELTRARIVTAARQEFGRSGFEASGVRTPRAWASRRPSRYSATSCEVKALVDATPISGPACV